MHTTTATCLLTLLLTCSAADSQILHSDNSVIHINAGGVLHVNGGVRLNNSSVLTNNGDFTTTKNSTLPEAGNFHFLNTSEVEGNGTYKIEQDWINDAFFNGDNSSVILYGNTQQYITSNNSTSTEFNNLTLTGNGTGVNRRKTLVNTDASCGSSGTLNLNDRELHTGVNSFYVINNAINAIQHVGTFGNEGFVSSLAPGFLYRSTNENSSFLFPVGSSEGTLRYRPVTILPENNLANEYAVRFNNYSADIDTYLLSQKEDDIQTANSLFYHSIERASGASASNVRIHYLPSLDGEWFGMANWSTLQDLWLNMGETVTEAISNYSYTEKADWNFENNFLPYLLINVSEELTIPNVFTPDNDGINDFFQISSKGLTEFNLTIVNRWGNVVFETTNSDSGWDGTTNGVRCSDGTYFYILNAKSKTKEYKKHGHLTLIGN